MIETYEKSLVALTQLDRLVPGLADGQLDTLSDLLEALYTNIDTVRATRAGVEDEQMPLLE